MGRAIDDLKVRQSPVGQKRWPRRISIVAPYPKLSIVDRGMHSIQADACVADTGQYAFFGELSAVNSDDGDVRWVSLPEPPQLRQDVKAVDSAVGPEIEQEHLPAKVGQVESTATRVNPLH